MIVPEFDFIHYRFVINDMACRPWEPMEEIGGTTLLDLAKYLNTCEKTTDLLGEPWNYKRLKPAGGFDPHVIAYGLRSQFYIPTTPTADDFMQIKKLDDSCVYLVTCCGERLKVEEDTDRALFPDEGYSLVCRSCDRHTIKFNGKVHRTKEEAWKRWITLYGESDAGRK